MSDCHGMTRSSHLSHLLLLLPLLLLLLALVSPAPAALTKTSSYDRLHGAKVCFFYAYVNGTVFDCVMGGARGDRIDFRSTYALPSSTTSSTSPLFVYL